MQWYLESNQVAIRVKPNPLKVRTSLPYLRQTVMHNNSDWVLLYSNLQKYQSIWGMVSKVMGKTGLLIKARVNIYKAVLQAVLLYERKRWVVTYVMMMIPEGLHHRIVRRVLGMTARKDNGR